MTSRAQLARKGRAPAGAVTMSHGSGGKATHTLIETVFLKDSTNPRSRP